jgi:hypothetical protein
LISRAPDITRLLDRLEKRDLVQRVRRAENRRVVDVEIKPAGMELLDQLTAVVRRVNQSQLGHMKPAELKELTRLLEAARWPHEEPGGLWGRPESLATQSSSGAPVEGESEHGGR